MNDTQILNSILAGLRYFAVESDPISPALAGDTADWIERKRQESNPRRNPLSVKVTPIGAGTVNAGASFQEFWRCAHYPSAIDNYFSRNLVCEHGCHKSELRWYDNGCKRPTS